MTERWQRIKDILDRALDREPETRSDFLDRACAGDDALRAEVQSLLDAYAEGAPFFDRTRAPAQSSTPVSDSSFRGERVGPYRLLEEIGRGGMGVVYLAERADGQFEQRVALKLLPRHFETDDRIARFRTERQILADLDHPNIAQLLDAGVTGAGRPYLVMEHVEGLPITQYCAEQQLSVEARLKLLQTVCDAVQHAHRSLVVHRDLKPSNILVAKTEDGPRIKLLDFGIAKLLDDNASHTVPLTRTGEHLLTPEYAAPEQVRNDPITTAVDVYQLGVLAYELLTGRRPIVVDSSRLIAVERAVLETDPDKPSAAVHEADDTFTLPTDAVRKRLRGDLDTIVLKALRKEPAHRYASAQELADDVERHLGGHPIQARPATIRYRVRKFIGRHRVSVGVALMVMAVLTGFLLLLVQQRNAARRSAAQAEQVSDFLVTLFESGNPGATQGDTLTAPELLERGLDRVEDLDNQPTVQARMLDAIGQAQMYVGRYEDAHSSLERALALRRTHYRPDHPEVAQSWSHLGTLLRKGRNYAQAADAYRRALKRYRRNVRSPNLNVAEALGGLALALSGQGKPDSAEALLREALDMYRRLPPADRPALTTNQLNLAHILRSNGKLDEAESLYRTALDALRTSRDTANPRLASGLNNFAYLLKEKGAYAAAERHYREALEVHRSIYGPAHPNSLRIMINLYSTLRYQDKYDEAETVLREHVAISRGHYPASHWRLASSLETLGKFLLDRGQAVRAEAPLREATAIYTDALGPDHPWTIDTNVKLGHCLALLDQDAPAKKLLTESYAALQTIHPDSTTVNLPRSQAEARVGLGYYYAKHDRFARAESLLTRSYDFYRADLPPNSLPTLQTRRYLGDLYAAWGKPEQAAHYRTSPEN